MKDKFKIGEYVFCVHDYNNAEGRLQLGKIYKVIDIRENVTTSKDGKSIRIEDKRHVAWWNGDRFVALKEKQIELARILYHEG